MSVHRIPLFGVQKNTHILCWIIQKLLTRERMRYDSVQNLYIFLLISIPFMVLFSIPPSYTQK